MTETKLPSKCRLNFSYGDPELRSKIFPWILANAKHMSTLLPSFAEKKGNAIVSQSETP